MIGLMIPKSAIIQEENRIYTALQVRTQAEVPCV